MPRASPPTLSFIWTVSDFLHSTPSQHHCSVLLSFLNMLSQRCHQHHWWAQLCTGGSILQLARPISVWQEGSLVSSNRSLLGITPTTKILPHKPNTCPAVLLWKFSSCSASVTRFHTLPSALDEAQYYHLFILKLQQMIAILENRNCTFGCATEFIVLKFIKWKEFIMLTDHVTITCMWDSLIFSGCYQLNGVREGEDMISSLSSSRRNKLPWVIHTAQNECSNGESLRKHSMHAHRT